MLTNPLWNNYYYPSLSPDPSIATGTFEKYPILKQIIKVEIHPSHTGNPKKIGGKNQQFDKDNEAKSISLNFTSLRRKKVATNRFKWSSC